MKCCHLNVHHDVHHDLDHDVHHESIMTFIMTYSGAAPHGSGALPCAVEGFPEAFREAL